MDTRPAIDFSGRTVVITGAGRGLGRELALDVARRGATVLVGDAGVDGAGAGADRGPADEVVDRIRATGGTAHAAYHDVSTRDGATALVAEAIATTGRVDALALFAGVLRDAPFTAVSDDDVRTVMDIHLTGAYWATQAAYRRMVEQDYGRIVLVSSAAAAFGKPEQTAYAAAKAGVLGLARTVALEGAAHGVRANAVLPLAATRMADGADEQAVALAALVGNRAGPAWATGIATWLASEACDVSGEAFSCAFGRYARVFTAVTPGWTAPDGTAPSAEDVAAHLALIEDRSGATVPGSVLEEIAGVVDDIRRAKTPGHLT